jgi:uncharacterized protein YecE (DUF72 family)
MEGAANPRWRGGLRAYAQHCCWVRSASTALYGADRRGRLCALRRAGSARSLPRQGADVRHQFPLRDERGNFIDSPNFLDAASTIDGLSSCMAGLAATPLVFQFPPMGRAAREPDRFINRLYHFLKSLPADGGAFCAEVRDAGIAHRPVSKCLQSTGVPLRSRPCAHARSGAANRTGRRFRTKAHSSPAEPACGVPVRRCQSRYFPFNRLVDEDADSRASLARACRATLQRGFDTYVIVNNKAEGSAPRASPGWKQIATAAKQPDHPSPLPMISSLFRRWHA